MSGLTDAQKKFYEDALEQTRTEIQDLEGQIQVELGKEIGRASCRERV